MNRIAMRRLTAVCLTCVALVAAPAAQELRGAEPGPGTDTSKAQWNVRGNLPPEKFVIQSHRGAGELAPENTMEAFELGWKLGTYPECDVRTTRDGRIVTFHDNDFSRVVKNVPEDMKKKGVADVTWEELSKLDVGTWKGEQFRGRRVSTLGEVLERMKGRPERHLYLDIKNMDLARLAAEVRALNVEKQVVLASTKYEQIRQWKALVPQSDTLLWMGGTEAALRKRLAELRDAGFADVTQLQVHVRMKPDADVAGRDPFTLPDSFLAEVGRELRARNIVYQCLPWGVSDPRVYWKLLDLGVMSFATDHPDVTTDAVRRYYAGQTTSGGKP